MIPPDALPDRAQIVIVGQLDRFANSGKPQAIHRYLTARGHDVELLDTYHLSRLSQGSRLPASSPGALALYLVEICAALLRRWSWGWSHLSYAVLVADLSLRARLIGNMLQRRRPALVICETPYDAECLLRGLGSKTFYDCPTPWADELFDEGRLTSRQRDRLRRREARVMEHVDYLSFHWQTYADYAVRNYGISGSNLVTMNFGCELSTERAEFNSAPRVVYLGSLSSRFIDLPLLARLAATGVPIDVYGGPPPDPVLGLRYLGYADPNVLLHYQAGLVTCTRDELRREGFSAKHLEYLAHGLPVLVPSWRKHLELLRGSVAYDEETFVRVVASLGDRMSWQHHSDAAYAEASRRRWDRALRPLDGIVAAL